MGAFGCPWDGRKAVCRGPGKNLLKIRTVSGLVNDIGHVSHVKCLKGGTLCHDPILRY